MLVPCLLAAAVYYGSFINLNSVMPKPVLALEWFQGIQGPTGALSRYTNGTMYADIPNSTLQSYNLGLAFVLQNGTEVNINDMLWYVHNTNIIPPDDPEFNGTIGAIQDGFSMSVSLENREYIVGNDSTLHSYSATPVFNGVYYNMSTTLNTTLSTVLVTQTKTFDMGSYAMQWGPGIGFVASNPGSIGYWLNASHDITNAPYWSIGSADLSNFLEGSGNATIEFDASFSVHVDYTFYYPDNTTTTGETNAIWNGTMGTFNIGYDQTGIHQLNYDWTRIIFILVPQT